MYGDNQRSAQITDNTNITMFCDVQLLPISWYHQIRDVVLVDILQPISSLISIFSLKKETLGKETEVVIAIANLHRRQAIPHCNKHWLERLPEVCQF